MKKDISYHKGTYENWKKKVLNEGEEGLSEENSKLLLDYIFDMEIGRNISNKNQKKGGRGFGRLNVQRRKLKQIMAHFKIPITEVKEKDLLEWANDLYHGRIKREDGLAYKSPVDFIRSFRAFWNWWIKVNKKKEIVILDIAEELPIIHAENTFVYLTKEQVYELAEELDKENVEYGVLVRFLFDGISRFPTETASLDANCIYEKEGEVWVSIPDEVSKTFGREYNLIYCGKAVLDFIKQKKLEPHHDLFSSISNGSKVYNFNKKLKEVAERLFGNNVSHPKAKKKYSEISGYDFRHSGAVNLRFLAHKNGRISLDAIRHRGGWTDFKMLNYYTKFLGLDGKISKEDTLLEEDKTKLEKEVEALKKEMSEFKEGFVQDFTKTLMKKFKMKEEDIYLSSRSD
jgi:hypothetical protein